MGAYCQSDDILVLRCLNDSSISVAAVVVWMPRENKSTLRLALTFHIPQLYKPISLHIIPLHTQNFTMAGGSGHNSTMKHQKSTPRFGPLSDRVNNASSQNSRVLNSTPKGSESRFIQARSALFEERAIAFQPKPASPDTEKSATRLGYPPREDSHRDLNAALGSYSAYLPLIEEKSPPASPALADKVKRAIFFEASIRLTDDTGNYSTSSSYILGGPISFNTFIIRRSNCCHQK